MRLEKINREKSGLLYDYIDQSDFYTNPVRKKRGQNPVANIPSPSEELDAKFVEEATPWI